MCVCVYIVLYVNIVSMGGCIIFYKSAAAAAATGGGWLACVRARYARVRRKRGKLQCVSPLRGTKSPRLMNNHKSLSVRRLIRPTLYTRRRGHARTYILLLLLWNRKDKTRRARETEYDRRDGRGEKDEKRKYEEKKKRNGRKEKPISRTHEYVVHRAQPNRNSSGAYVVLF